MMYGRQLTHEDLDKKAIFVAVGSVVRVALLPGNPIYSESGEYQIDDNTM